MSSNDSDIVPGPSPVAPAPISSASGLSLHTIAPSIIREKQPVKLRENRRMPTIRWGGFSICEIWPIEINRLRVTETDLEIAGSLRNDVSTAGQASTPPGQV